MKKTKKFFSTFEREMQKPAFKKKFEQSYKNFLLSELIIMLMENDAKSIRKLADEVGLSPTVIQKIRSGDQEDIKLSNFLSISHACGFHVTLKKGNRNITLC